MANDRKKRLHELKKEAEQNRKHEDTRSGSANKTEGDDINKFIKDIVERKKERKKQLEIIHHFFENPAAYGIDTDLIPSSTTREEVESRKKELQHKIDLLRSVLKALEGEMQMLSQMKQTDDSNDSPPTKKKPRKKTSKKKAVRKKQSRS
jgi:hypothetical protein